MGTHYGIRPQGNTPFVKGRIVYYDFTRNVYVDTIANRRTFEEAVNFSRASNATMVDSDGLIKWAPHNLWGGGASKFSFLTPSDCTFVPDGSVADPFGGYAAYRMTGTGGLPRLGTAGFSYGVQTTRGLWVRAVSGSGTVVIGNRDTTSKPEALKTINETWQFLTTKVDPADAFSSVFYPILLSGTVNDVYVYAPVIYRSDLGGMVNNPERGDGYVPTTGTAKYLPRIGHHYYDGEKYVNGGLLLENRSSTNFIPNSSDFSDFGGATKTQDVGNASPIGDDFYLISQLDSASFQTFQYNWDMTNIDPAASYTFSFIAKRANTPDAAPTIHHSLEATSLGVKRSAFDLVNGVVLFGDSTTSKATMEDLGDGVYRCSVTYSGFDGTDTIGRIRLHPGYADGNRNVNDAASYCVIAPQLEESPCPTSYIPTDGSTATRALETAELDDNIYGTIFDQVGGTTLMDVRIPSYANCTLWKSIFRNTNLSYAIQDGLNTINSRIDGIPRVTTNRFNFPDLPISTDIFDLKVGFRFSPTLGSQTAGNGLVSTINDGGVENIDFNNFPPIYLGTDPSSYTGMRGLIRSVRMYDRPIEETELIQESTL